MKTLLLIFTLILIANTAMAQSDDALNSFSDDVKSAKRGDAVSISGSAYDDVPEARALFYMKDKQVIEKETKLNYYHSNFEYVDKDKTFLADASAIDSIVFRGDAYVYRNFAIQGTKKLRIVKVIGQIGAQAFYFYKEIVFKPAIKAGGYIDPKPARYERGEEVYLFESGDKIIIINNFKELIALFPGKENDIKKFIKDNGISKNKPGELKKLLLFVSQF